MLGNTVSLEFDTPFLTSGKLMVRYGGPRMGFQGSHQYMAGNLETSRVLGAAIKPSSVVYFGSEQRKRSTLSKLTAVI
jgi:hypothetical protein